MKELQNFKYMGSACSQCLKNGITSKIDEASEISINHADVRLTRHIKTGYTFENISFFITTQPLYKTKLDIVIMFVDKLQGLVDNPYIRELGTRDKAKIQKRIEQIKDRVQFDREGDYVNMIYPFDVCEIGSLLVAKVGLLGRNEQFVLSESIQKIFEETQRKCLTIPVPSIGVVEVHSKLGYSSAKFQTEILRHLNQLFRGRNATFVYFTFTEERLQNFINFLLNPENSFSLNNITSNSSYF